MKKTITIRILLLVFSLLFFNSYGQKSSDVKPKTTEKQKKAKDSFGPTYRNRYAKKSDSFGPTYRNRYAKNPDNSNLQQFEIKPYAGFSQPLGSYSKFSKTGAVVGLSLDYFLMPNFALGIDINSQFNGFKHPFDFSRIPQTIQVAKQDTSGNIFYETEPVNLFESQNGSWTTTTLSFGPTYRMNYKKFSSDLYTKAGLSILSTPEARTYHEYDLTETDLFLLNKQNSVSFGMTSGARFYYHINKMFSVYVNPQVVFTAAKVNYSYVDDLDPAFNTGSLTVDSISGFDREAVRDLESQNASFNPVHFNLNAGLSINIGTKPKPKQIKDSFGPTYRVNYKKSINNEEGKEIFKSSRIKKVEQPKQEECLAISQPRNGNNYSIEKDVYVSIKNPKGSKNTSLTLYKISDDPEYWNKEENFNQLMDGDNPSAMCSSYEKEAKETKFEPLNLKSKPKGENLEAFLEKNSLKEGSYKLVATNNCGATSSNFTLKSGGCGNISSTLDISCDGFENGKPKYTVSLVFANSSSPAKACDAIYDLMTSSTGTISNLVPLNHITVPAGGNSSPVTFNYVPNNTSTTYAAFYFRGKWTDGEQNSVNFRDTIANIPKCICDFCESEVDFDSDENPNATYNIRGNSLTINQNWWNMYTNRADIVGAKAEIISFKRYVSDECMRCDKDSKQWGNFISGNLNQTNGSFANANNAVDGNTHHTLYFDNPDPNSSSFDLNIAIPPLSTLGCCCEKMLIQIRYTYTFKDKEGNCKMCSSVFAYSFQKGECKTKPDIDWGGSVYGGGQVINWEDVIVKDPVVGKDPNVVITDAPKKKSKK